MNNFSAFSGFLNSLAPKKTAQTGIQTPYDLSGYGMSTIPAKPATTPIATSAPAATSPQVKPLTSVTSTPAASAYVKSLSATPAPITNITSNYATAVQGQSPTITPNQNQGINTGNNVPVASSTPAQDAYLKYLTSMFDPEKTSAAQVSLNAANQRLTDIQNQEEAKSLSARRDYESTLDAPGGTVSGARDSAQALSRRNNSELADLAVRESAAARSAGVARETYNAYIDAGKTAAEAEKAANAAAATSKQQDIENKKPINVNGSLYQLQSDGSYKSIAGNEKLDTSVVDVGGRKLLVNNQTGATIKDLGIGSIGSANTGTYTEGSNPSVDGWVKQINSGAAKISDVPASLKGLVVQGLSSGTAQVSQLKTDALTSAKALLDKFTSGSGTSAVGTSRIFGLQYLPGTAAKDLSIQFDNLKSLLSLDNIKLLKGQGAVSDSERKLLADASAKLSLSQSEKEFKSALQDIINGLSTSNSNGYGAGTNNPLGI